MSGDESEDLSLKKPFTWKPSEPDPHSKCLFLTFKGNSLEFYVHDDPISVRRLVQLICKYGGKISSGSVGPSSVVLVREDRTVPQSWGPVYSRQYIRDCIVAFTLLDLDSYLIPGSKAPGQKGVASALFEETFSFRPSPLQITDFFGVGGKKTDTGKAKSKPKKKAISTDDSDEDLSPSLISSRLKLFAIVDKHSKTRFSRREKEAIIQYIVAKKAFFRLKSDALYREMESRSICPKRTFQSMKNHFLKKLLHELDSFPFLSDSTKKKLRGETW